MKFKLLTIALFFFGFLIAAGSASAAGNARCVWSAVSGATGYLCSVKVKEAGSWQTAVPETKIEGANAATGCDFTAETGREYICAVKALKNDAPDHCPAASQPKESSALYCQPPGTPAATAPACDYNITEIVITDKNSVPAPVFPVPPTSTAVPNVERKKVFYAHARRIGSRGISCDIVNNYIEPDSNDINKGKISVCDYDHAEDGDVTKVFRCTAPDSEDLFRVRCHANEAPFCSITDKVFHTFSPAKPPTCESLGGKCTGKGDACLPGEIDDYWCAESTDHCCGIPKTGATATPAPPALTCGQRGASLGIPQNQLRCRNHPYDNLCEGLEYNLGATSDCKACCSVSQPGATNTPKPVPPTATPTTIAGTGSVTLNTTIEMGEYEGCGDMTKIILGDDEPLIDYISQEILTTKITGNDTFNFYNVFPGKWNLYGGILKNNSYIGWLGKGNNYIDVSAGKNTFIELKITFSSNVAKELCSLPSGTPAVLPPTLTPVPLTAAATATLAAGKGTISGTIIVTNNSTTPVYEVKIAICGAGAVGAQQCLSYSNLTGDKDKNRVTKTSETGNTSVWSYNFAYDGQGLPFKDGQSYTLVQIYAMDDKNNSLAAATPNGAIVTVVNGRATQNFTIIISFNAVSPARGFNFRAVMQGYGQRNNSSCDVNGDGLCDELDLSLVLSSLGQPALTPVP